MSSMKNPLPGIEHVTPADSDFSSGRIARGLLIGTDGDIKITDGLGKIQTIPSGVLAVGVFHPIELQRVWETSTTAENIYCGFDKR